MVKHIILWTLKEMSDSEKESVKKGIKDGLEGLKGKIPGLIDIKVNTEGRLVSSTADLMLDSTFENDEALKGYSKHPEHVAVADSKVRPYTSSRSCLDFEV
ncbi:MAG: Dabb family protein [Spirochaetaceae bacterium]|nr:Dabb family protein [Spirochaetaceae bacterium]